MPLVDYESSDEGSENDCVDNEKDEKQEVRQNQEKQEISVTKPISGTDAVHNNSSLFSALPKPRTSFSFLSDENDLSKLLLNKKSSSIIGKTSDKESVKISVPRVSDFIDDDQPSSKKPKPSPKGMGLFSVLPPPKNVAVKESNRQFIPNIVSKSQAKNAVIKEKNVIQKNIKSEVGAGKKTNDEDDDIDDTPIGNSFFGSSLSKPGDIEDLGNVNYNQNFSAEVIKCENNQELVTSLPWNENDLQPTSSNTSLDIRDNYMYPTDSCQTGESISVESNPLELDEKALHILCGGKKKRQQMPMNIIDLSGEEIMPDSKEWLLKQFTEEKKTKSHSHRKHNGPSTQSRRKHQITYLAFQAKEQELELQNQWANNRMSRKQTQSKYGF